MRKKKIDRKKEKEKNEYGKERISMYEERERKDMNGEIIIKTEKKKEMIYIRRKRKKKINMEKERISIYEERERKDMKGEIMI